MLNEVSRLMQEVQAGRGEPKATAAEIRRLLQEAPFVPPAFGLADPDNQWTDATTAGILKTLRWAKKEAPPVIGELTYDGLTLFMKKRFAKGEFEPKEELKQIMASWPIIGKRLRVPAPQ